MKITAILLVFLGGGIGSVLRFLFSLVFKIPNSGFPLSTFMANLTACFILGYLSIRLTADNELLRLFLAVGLCGGFSTFSTFIFEGKALAQSGQWAMLLFYLVGSVVCCALGMILGIKMS